MYVTHCVMNVVVAEVRRLTWNRDSDLANYQQVALPRRLARETYLMKRLENTYLAISQLARVNSQP